MSKKTARFMQRGNDKLIQGRLNTRYVTAKTLLERADELAVKIAEHARRQERSPTKRRLWFIHHLISERKAILDQIADGKVYFPNIRQGGTFKRK